MLGLSIRLIDQYQISVGLTIAIHKQQEQFHDIVIIQLTAQVVVNISQPCDCLVDWLIITRPMLLFPGCNYYYTISINSGVTRHAHFF